jgi:hypothetical protein
MVFLAVIRLTVQLRAFVRGSARGEQEVANAHAAGAGGRCECAKPFRLGSPTLFLTELASPCEGAFDGCAMYTRRAARAI